MNLKFGMDLDGSEWDPRATSIGSVRLGPGGLLELLETRLGLTGLRIPPAQRIDQYLARLESCDHDGSWAHGSLVSDSWSTAVQLLGWRDELIEAGWNGRTGGDASDRLLCLSRAEQVEDLPLAPGRADRLRAVMDQLHSGRRIGIAGVALHEPMSQLPPAWSALMERLSAMGTRVEADSTPASTPNDSDLARIQSAISTASRIPARTTGDETLLLLDAADDWEAAEAMALWLRESFDSGEAITIICESDSELLDQALGRQGLPTVGRSRVSSWRGVLQLLPLVLANAWEPVDVRRLAELLVLGVGPVRGGAARRLLKALNEEPGVGGREWHRALDEVESRKIEWLRKAGKDCPELEAEKFRQSLDNFLGSRRFPAEPGIPEDELHARCDWVIGSLASSGGADPLLAKAIGHATEMQAMARGKKLISRIRMERMLDSVIGRGSSSPDRAPEASPWEVVRTPGQVTRPVDTVLWWGFTHSTGTPATWWTGPELSALERDGVSLESPQRRRQREGEGWRRPLLNARERVLFFHPRRREGEPTEPHPLWDEIRNAAGVRHGSTAGRVIEQALRRDCAELKAGGLWRLAGRNAQLQPVQVRANPAPDPNHRIDGGSLIPPKKLSFTQMSSMIGCPLRGALDQVGLRPSRLRNIPSGSRMIGNFCHRIVERLLGDPIRNLSPAEARMKARVLYDALAPSMASELLLVGRELENQRCRAAVIEAVHALVTEINRHGLVVEATESRLERTSGTEPVPAGCVSFSGRADLILRDDKGGRFLLDLKWSSSDRYKKEELKNGAALQLAAYAWLLRTEEADGEVHAGYFMLAQGELLSPSTGFGERGAEAAYSLDETWERGMRSWNHRWSTLESSNTLEATGISERNRGIAEAMSKEKVQEEAREAATFAGRLYVQPPCIFCNFSPLCGLTGSDS